MNDKSKRNKITVLSIVISELRNEPYFKSINELSRRTGIRWETIKNVYNELNYIGVIHFDDKLKKYHYEIVPISFFLKYKEEQEQYIKALEMRILKLKYTKVQE